MIFICVLQWREFRCNYRTVEYICSLDAKYIRDVFLQLKIISIFLQMTQICGNVMSAFDVLPFLLTYSSTISVVPLLLFSRLVNYFVFHLTSGGLRCL